MKTQTLGRLVYIEPNDVSMLGGYNSNDGKTHLYDGVYWNEEDLNMSVDLQVVMPYREDCGQCSLNSSNFYVQIQNDNQSDVGRYVSFLQGSNINNTNGEKIGNQLTTSYLEASYEELRRDGKSNKECLGIDSVDITFDSHFYPQVNIKFIDNRGYSLMMPSEHEYLENLREKEGGGTAEPYSNFFRALFHFPYPRFLLTIKGYYGNSVTFMLAVNEFKNNFNSSTGNFEINVSFIGYMYGLYTDIPLNLLITAPYYNRNEDEWNNFKFDNQNGAEGGSMLTFVEFIRKCNELNDLKKDLTSGESGNASTDELIQLTNKKTWCRNMITIIKEMMHDTVNGYNVNKADYKFFADNGDLNCLFREKEINICVNKKKYEELRSLYNDNQYGVALSNISSSWLDDGKLVADACRNKSLETKLKDIILEEKDDWGEMSKNFYSKNKAKYGEWYTFRVAFNSVITELSALIDEINTKSNELSAEVESNLDSTYQEALGFVPTIQNFFRMIFAHMSKFMTDYYDLLAEIKESKREMGAMKLTAQTCDMNKYSAENAFVPPFPAVYKEEDNKRVEVYPGEIDSLTSLMPEIAYTEGFINAAMGVKDEFNNIITQYAEKQAYDKEIQAAKDAGGSGWTATSVSDYWFKDEFVNPYANLESNVGSDIEVGGLLYFFMCRDLSNKLQFGSKERNGFAEAEANNYLSIHKTPSCSQLKNKIKEIKGDAAKIKEEINNYITKKGSNSLILPIKSLTNTPNGVISLKETSVPLWFRSLKVKSDNFAYYKNTDKIKYTFLIDDNYSLASQAVSKLQNLGQPFLDGCVTALPTEVSISNFDGSFDNFDAFSGSTYDYYTICKEWEKEDTGGQKAAIRDGSYFFNSHYKNGINTENQIKDFIMALMSKVKSTNYIDIKIDTTCIRVINKATAILLGAIAKGLVQKKNPLYNSGARIVPFISKTTYSDTGTEKVPIEENVFGIKETVFDFIVNDSTANKAFSTYFDDFKNSTEWKNIRNLITYGDFSSTPPKGNYKIDSGVYRLKIWKSISVILNQNLLIYNINNENNNTLVSINLGDFQPFLNTIYNAYKDTKALDESWSSDFIESDISSEHKLALYKTFKNLYDRWANSYSKNNFILRSPSEDHSVKVQRFSSVVPYDDKITEFDNFLFVDSYYNDISYKFKINPSTVCDLLAKHLQNDSNYSVYEFMAELCQANRMLLLAMPVYNNYYSSDTIKNIFSPQPSDIMKTGYGSTYVCMYTYEVSHIVEAEDSTSMDDDGFDIADINGNIMPEETTIGLLFNDANSEDDLSLTVPAFGVTYARQNQMYFKTINVNMDNPRVTDYSIANLFELKNLTKDGTLNRPQTVANDIYSVYANRSYNCSVDMMGCANIMPMMYFQLNNIPMFRGAYMITNVEHHIKAGDFSTKFTGVRVSKNQLPYSDRMFNLSTLLDITTTDEISTKGNRASGVDNSSAPTCANFATLVQESMSKKWHTFKDKTVIPYNNPKYISRCGQAVKEFCIHAGVNNVSGDGFGWYDTLKNNRQFTLVYTIPAKATCDERCSTVAAKSKIGDIAVMKQGANEFKKAKGYYGHVCMYYGNGEWVSDCNQQKAGRPKYDMYVYEKNGGTNAQEIFVFRYTCGYVSGGTVPAISNNATTNTRGKAIMTALKNAFSFTDEQLIGIGSAIYQESEWDPKAVSSSGTYRGIIQWNKDRYEPIINYLNDKNGTSYKVANFIQVPLNHQIEGMIWELNNSEKTALAEIKKKKTSREIAIAWTKYYERGADSQENYNAHAAHTDIAKKALDS